LKKKNLHLIISIVIILPVALIYGLHPNGIFNDIFRFKIDTINLSGIFRAVMGLYIAMATFWFIAIMRPGLWIAATTVNILFMGGLAIGRITSIALDGVPSPVFVIGLILEILLAIWGIINLKQYKFKPGRD